MQTLSQLAKQKAEVEKEKRQALAKQSETGVKAKEKEHATIHQQENQFTGILSKLLALHGTKSPDAYVPVIQKSSKSGGGGKKR
jgi:sRNA-binding protein